ncbi:MAG: glycerophosphoryl diester phosphodiesterase [Pseudonocardiales bacterium]|nr:glycerophosphoryl diester phosphodiesterase [Pseudonocardiales bacterium]
MSEGDAGNRAPPRRVADLVAPFWIAHRGMANVYPENTLEAYRGTVALGIDVVEPDCWLTRDGGLVCLHDATVERTTDGSGNTDELTVPGAELLHVDAGTWFAAAWPNTLRVPTFADVLDELGGRAVLCPEAKNAGAGRAIVDLLARYGHLDAAIVQSFTQAELDPAVAAGGDAMMLTATSIYDPAALRATGVRYLGLSAALPPSLVSPAMAAGLDVVIWVVNRRVDAAPWLASGATGFFSDDPLYLSGRSPVLTSDPFGQRTYYHGHLANSIAGDRGTFSAPHTWGYADTSPAYKGALQGWASPINGAATGRFGLAFTVHIDRAAAQDGWAGAFLCAADDRSFDDADRHQPGLGGYHALLRQSGSLELHIVDHGIATLASSAATPPIEPASTATLRIDVSPARVAVTRTDIAPTATVTVADATHRGGYFHLGRRAAAVRFSDIAIS